MNNLTNDTSDISLAQPKKRPAPGERRLQILQALVTMLEQSGAERITTAALAKAVNVSEAALYRHFASKAQMFEGLLDFIETSAFGLIQQIKERSASPKVQATHMVVTLLQFADHNPGITRVMVGDALIGENDRLLARMNLFFDKIEAALRQVLREDNSGPQPTVQAQLRASVLVAYLSGCLQSYVRSGFRKKATDNSEAALALILR